MLNRLVIFICLVFSSVAIPMQTETIYQTRTIQSVDYEKCSDEHNKMVIAEDILSATKDNKVVNSGCKN